MKTKPTGGKSKEKKRVRLPPIPRRWWQFTSALQTTRISSRRGALQRCGCAPAKWKWHLRPFIQLEAGSRPLLEWAHWRTYSLGSKFLSELPETWCSWGLFSKITMADLGPKCKTGSLKIKFKTIILQLRFSLWLRLQPQDLCWFSHCAANIQQPAVLRPGAEAINHTRSPLPDSSPPSCATKKPYVCMAACFVWSLSRPAPDGDAQLSAFVFYHDRDSPAGLPILLTHPWD